jgi:hypothetical protein
MIRINIQTEDNMKWIDNFIPIESFKYDNEKMIELQRFDKLGNLLEHKTSVQQFVHNMIEERKSKVTGKQC